MGGLRMYLQPCRRSKEFTPLGSRLRLRCSFSFGFSIVLFQTQRPGDSFLSFSACCALAVCPCPAAGALGTSPVQGCLGLQPPGHPREAGASLCLPRLVTLGQEDCHRVPLFPA